jgi:hypothetical protein
VPTAGRAAFRYVDKKDSQRAEVYAKVVVLAASCCETARILLNSKSSRAPERGGEFERLGGALPHGYRRVAVGGFLPILQDLPPQNEDGVGGMHLYMPWWNYQAQKAGKMPFARGYHIEIGGGRSHAGGREFWEARSAFWAAATGWN